MTKLDTEDMSLNKSWMQPKDIQHFCEDGDPIPSSLSIFNRDAKSELEIL